MQLQKFSATAIGAITGLMMIIINFLLFKLNVENIPGLQYLSYAVYGLGIVYVVTRFAKQNKDTITFGNLFNQGFKCFIIVTLLMTVYIFLYFKLQPQLIETMANEHRKEMLANEKNRTPKEIEDEINQSKKMQPLAYASAAVFGFLLTGSIVTLAASGAHILNKKN